VNDVGVEWRVMNTRERRVGVNSQGASKEAGVFIANYPEYISN
jgi:hypothetical protein